MIKSCESNYFLNKGESETLIELENKINVYKPVTYQWYTFNSYGDLRCSTEYIKTFNGINPKIDFENNKISIKLDKPLEQDTILGITYYTEVIEPVWNTSQEDFESYKGDRWITNLDGKGELQVIAIWVNEQVSKNAGIDFYKALGVIAWQPIHKPEPYKG